MEKKMLKVGQIVNTQGIKGELRVYPLTDYKERFEELEWVYIDKYADKRFYIEKVKYKNDLVILKMKEIEDINEAEKYKNCYLLIDKLNTRKLPENTYLIADLIDMKVYSEENKFLGILKDVLQAGGNDVYEISSPDRPGKNILIPAVGEFIKKVDFNNNTIVVKLIEGMLDED